MLLVYALQIVAQAKAFLPIFMDEEELSDSYGEQEEK
jgi:hypothetical protein